MQNKENFILTLENDRAYQLLQTNALKYGIEDTVTPVLVESNPKY